MPISSLTIISRSMTARLFSTVTTVLTVAVAVALLVVLLAMQQAGLRAFSRGSGNMHLVLSNDSGPLPAVLNNVFHAGIPKNSLTWVQFQTIMSRPRPAAPPVIAMCDWAIPLQAGDSYQGFPVVATSRAFFEKFEPVAGEPLKLTAGAFFESPMEPALNLQEPLHFTRDRAALQAVAGADAALGAHLTIGQKVRLAHGTGEHADHLHEEDTITIVGILKPTGTAHDRVIFIDLGTAWLLHARDFYEQIEHDAGIDHEEADHAEADAHDHPAIPTFDEYIAASYEPRITGVYLRAATRPGKDTSAALPPLLAALRADPLVGAVASPTDQIQALFRIVGNINQVLVAMAGAVVLSSAIAIMLALYNSMEQRRRQIAVLRVLGASRTRIFTLIVAESAILGLIGSFGGLALAGLGAALVSGAMQQRLGLAVEPTLWLTITLGSSDSAGSIPLTPILIIATVALAALAGVVPAVMAYRTSVARSLRPLG